MELKEQIEKLFANINNDEIITADEFINIFLLGFVRQMQINPEQYFKFNVSEQDDNGNFNIEATLKNDFSVICNIAKEFILKENLELTKQMFGVPTGGSFENISDGVVEVPNDK